MPVSTPIDHIVTHRVSMPVSPPGEMPTWALAFTIHCGWLAMTWWHASLPFWITAIIGGWMLSWHGSFQHETIHGHPTSRPWLNALLGSLPLALLFPYLGYRRIHREHHRTPTITDPIIDPESRYLSGREGKLAFLAARLEAPLFGRLVFGPVFAVVRLLVGEARQAVKQPAMVVSEWLPHLLGVGLVVGWLRFCGFDIGQYLLICVYPSMSLTLLRSFAEHRADEIPGHRVATVESQGPLALLFLNNNLHAAHHYAPSVAWHALPTFFKTHRDAILSASGGPVYRGYREIAARYLLRAHDSLVHPDHG